MAPAARTALSRLEARPSIPSLIPKSSVASTTSAMCVSRSADVELTCNSFDRADRVQLMRRIRSPARNGRIPANSLPSPPRLERCSPIRPSLGRVEALTSNERRERQRRQRMSRRDGRPTERCPRAWRPRREWARSAGSPTVSTAPGGPGGPNHRRRRLRRRHRRGFVWIHGAASSSATARSSSATPETAPCQVVASPSRIVRVVHAFDEVRRYARSGEERPRGHDGQRCGDHEEIRPPPDESEREHGDRTDRSTEVRNGRPPGAHRSGTGSGRFGSRVVGSSAAGAGTEDSTASTTVRPVTWLIHISGFTVMR